MYTIGVPGVAVLDVSAGWCTREMQISPDSRVLAQIKAQDEPGLRKIHTPLLFMLLAAFLSCH